MLILNNELYEGRADTQKHYQRYVVRSIQEWVSSQELLLKETCKTDKRERESSLH